MKNKTFVFLEEFKIIEALMYVQGDEGLSAKALKYVMKIPTEKARRLLKDFLKYFNAQENRGIFVIEFNDNFKFATKEELKPYIEQLVFEEKKHGLSPAAIETAAIIAYKQPITRSQINEIRGVSSEAVVSTLLLKGVIEEKGKAHTPGSPVLYGITNKFYDYFRLTSLAELPKLSEIQDLDNNEDSFDLFSSQREE